MEDKIILDPALNMEASPIPLKPTETQSVIAEGDGYLYLLENEVVEL